MSGNNAHGIDEYFEVGALCADTVESVLAADGTDLAELDSILDFGCGCGRVLRHVKARTEARLFGTDLNPALVEWCSRELPIGEFRVNGLEPPLSFAADSFDLVYAFSVFTHMPEDLQRGWIEELTRVLRPGGLLLLTTQGEAYETWLAEPERLEFRRAGLLVRDPSFAGSNRCLVYHTADYVTSTLAAGLEVRRFVPGAPIDVRRRLIGQDAYLLRKP